MAKKPSSKSVGAPKPEDGTSKPQGEKDAGRSVRVYGFDPAIVARQKLQREVISRLANAMASQTYEFRLPEKRRSDDAWMQVLRQKLSELRSALVYSEKNIPPDASGSVWSQPNKGSLCPLVEYLRLRAQPEWDDAEMRAEALARLWPALSHYEVLLYGFLPEDLLADARQLRAEWRYANCKNATARADWSTFTLHLNRKANAQTAAPGIVVGIPGVDADLNGLSDITVIGGDRGVGKTTLALQMAWASLRADVNLAVVIASLDMPKARIYERLLAYEAGVTYRELLHPQPTEEVGEKLEKAEAYLVDNVLPRLGIIDLAGWDATTPPLDNLQRAGDALVRASGASHLLLVVDLFQHMPVPPPDRSDVTSDHVRLDVLHEYRCRTRSSRYDGGDPVIAVSEIRKSGGARDSLSSNDLFGTGRLASDASTILLLSRGEADNVKTGVVAPSLQITKCRDGSERGTHLLHFDYHRYRFTDGTPPQSNAQGSDGPGAGRQINPAAVGKQKVSS